MSVENEKNMKENIKRYVEKAVNDQGMSPMSPPDYYEIPSVHSEIKYGSLPLPLRKLVDEHRIAQEHLDKLEATLLAFKETNFRYSQEISSSFRTFFEFFDTTLLPHHQKEDKYLFPLLEKYFLKAGEHSKYMSNNKFDTPIDVMEDDHLKMLQVGALVFNLLGIYVRIPDPTSRGIIADTIFNKGMEFIELLRIHIYQEETILFSKAAENLTKEELIDIEKYIH